MNEPSEHDSNQVRLELELGDVRGLIAFAADATTTLQIPDGRYCFDRTWTSPDLRGQSSRYALMVGLGFERAARAGYALPRPPTDILSSVLARPETLTPGDRGLAVWLGCRLDDERSVALLEELQMDVAGRTDELEGMEIAWMLLGAVEALKKRHESAEKLVVDVLAILRSRLSSRSPLVRHLGEGWRARFPNFATQIYSVLALAEASAVCSDDRALREARALADCLIELRRDDLGWPWLYDVESTTVVEPYEVYSVHQDAMAPMALFALSEASGDDRYAAAGAEGIVWCYGANELSFNFYDLTNRFAHRSIRRGGVAARALLVANTAGARLGTRRRLSGSRLPVAINDTCRPYHLGWILEAWAGREHWSGK